MNDERPLKRLMKKFHTFSTISDSTEDVEDAREAFLIELASFQLLLKKSAMICEAEARQVEEYQRERQRIGAFTLLLSHKDRCLTVYYT